MTTTNYPNGLSSFGIPVIGAGGGPLTGNVFFVSSVSGANGNPGSFDQPKATLAGAIASCVASRGDVIYLMAGHAETIAGAAGIAVNVAGIAIIGLGQGNNRPTFTFATSTAATMTITASNVLIANIVGTCSLDGIVSPFVISGANVVFGSQQYGVVEWQDGSSAIEAVRAVLTTATADNLTINLKHIGFTAGDANVNSIRLVGCNTGRINIDYYGIVSTAVVEFVTTLSTNIEIGGTFYVSGITTLARDVVDTVTGSTWGVQAFDAAAGYSFSGGSGAAVGSDDVSSVIDLQEKVVTSATAVMVTGNTIFTIAGGPIKIEALVSECVTANDGTASTLLYTTGPTVGSAQTISGASASLASAAAGASVTLAGTALATAALLGANGANLIANPGTIYVPAGTIKVTIAVGSTTGTWRHRLRYKPLATGVTVT